MIPDIILENRAKILAAWLRAINMEVVFADPEGYVRITKGLALGIFHEDFIDLPRKLVILEKTLQNYEDWTTTPATKT